MKALTIRQPWASLIASGVKTIETRSWRTSYRGPLAIHAGKHNPGGGSVGDWHYGSQRLWWTADPAFKTGDPFRSLPLGAVVATCTLADVVPIQSWPEMQMGCESGIWVDGAAGIINWFTRPERIDDQLPFGDFAPGRFAWLLTDIEPLPEPVPAKGRQGLWEWTP